MQSLVDQISGAMQASVALPTSIGLTVIARTANLVDELDRSIESPTRTAFRKCQISRVPTTQRADEFPEFVAHCRRSGICSVAAFPMVGVPRSATGVITILSADHHGFGARELRLGRECAETLGRMFVPIAASVCPATGRGR
jgi:hypothetical protein